MTDKNFEDFAAMIQKRMQTCLNRLCLPLQVLWKPDEDECKSVHGEIKNGFILIYDANESEAWGTFTHEIVEYKLQGVTRPYRLLVNNLIEAFEKTVYAEKEKFIEFTPLMMKVIEDCRKSKSDCLPPRRERSGDTC